HVAPLQMREPATAVGHVPSIQLPRELGNDEAGGAESVRREHGKRVLAKTAIGIVERDDDLARTNRTHAARAGLQFSQRQRSPAVACQTVDLAREAAR